MQIVIDIREDFLYEIKHKHPNMRTELEQSVLVGTVLPKGHGRLIDADEIQFENTEFETYGDYCIAFDAIDKAETIIEADK